MQLAIEERVSKVPTGRVKWYDADKGFGFLAQDGGEDVYVHRRARRLRRSDAVRRRLTRPRAEID